MGQKPLCRLCGQPIKKVTKSLSFGASRDASYYGGGMKEFVAKPTSKAEVARFDNGKIISVSWAGDRSYIRRAATWDGESYRDPYFCKGECARSFGYFALENGFEVQTQRYADAVAARSRKDPA